MSHLCKARVLSVHHWTDRLFSFTTTRDAGFRFHNGHFTLLGLESEEGRPLLRAYSMVSANHEDQLEFLSIKVPQGPLTSRLQHLQVGDEVVLSRKTTGTLTTAHLLPGRRLYLLATGTGLAPFMSIIRDPEIYAAFEQVILVHGCRHVGELAYREYIEHTLPNHEYLGEEVRQKLRYYPTVTREPFIHQGRIPALLESGVLARDLGLPPLSPAEDRVMLCGSPAMLRDTTTLLESLGLRPFESGQPGHYVIERAFVDK